MWNNSRFKLLLHNPRLKVWGYVIISSFLLISWKEKSFIDSNSKTKKLNVQLGEITVPSNWKIEIDSTSPIWFIHVNAGKFILTFAEIIALPEAQLHGDENDSICLKYFSPADSSYTLNYTFHCRKKTGPLIANYFIKPDASVLGVNSSSVNASQAAEILSILKTFQPFKSKKISIKTGEITVPRNWENIVLNYEEKIPAVYQYVTDGNDTLKFGNFQVVAEYDTMQYMACVNEKVDISDGGGSYIIVDTVCLNLNKKARKYNDSLIRMHPEIATTCHEYFMPNDSNFHMYYKFPCHTTSGILSGDIYNGKGFTGPCVHFESSNISLAKAEEFIRILKTFTPKK